jgi:hypothetical protein
MVASALWIDSVAFVGPLSHASNGSDFSVFTGLLVGGLVYWALARPGVARETAALGATNDSDRAPLASDRAMGSVSAATATADTGAPAAAADMADVAP